MHHCLSLEHCPKLECLQLHITLQLYFPESTHSKPDTFSTYEQIVANLRVGHLNHNQSKAIIIIIIILFG